MKVQWFCGRCGKKVRKKFNLRKDQEGFTIKVIQAECDAGHTKVVKI